MESGPKNIYTYIKQKILEFYFKSVTFWHQWVDVPQGRKRKLGEMLHSCD